jgi:diaminohydroxyphosphoribosylaminopyrimidine deaminase/5-amino-6-(5-phosphoribosylamino)uracil reductase
VIATGVHRLFGTAHGERDLLNNFADPVEPDDVLVVNLEPCCPSPTKKTPPCTEIILARGVQNVAFGMTDPDVRVAGNGLRILQDQGVQQTGPMLEQLCAEHNRGFTTLRLKNRPWTSLAADPDDITNRDAARSAAIVSADPEHLLTLLRREADYRPLSVYVGQEDVPELTSAGAKILRIGGDTRTRFEEITRILKTPDADYHGITSMILSGELAEDAMRRNAFDEILDGH